MDLENDNLPGTGARLAAMYRELLSLRRHAHDGMAPIVCAFDEVAEVAPHLLASL